MEDGTRLPNQVLAHIFSLLDTKDKINASSVCRHWMKVFNKNTVLLDGLSVCPDNLENIPKHLSTMTRKFSSFTFLYAIIDKEFFFFLERFAPQFRHLMFVHCPVLEEVEELDRKIQTCERLLELTILNCGPWNILEMFCHLPALQYLNLKVLYFSELEIVLLEETIPLSLRELRLVDVFLPKADYKRFVFEGLTDFIFKRFFSLESLDLSGLYCQGFVMDVLSKIEGSRLKRLKVFPNSLPRNCIEYFCNNHRKIKMLNLKNPTGDFRRCTTHNVTDSTVVAVCNSLPLLEELDISGCTGIDESVAMIFKLKRLRRLSLNGCNRISKESFFNALKGLTCKNLRVIGLRDTQIDRLFLSAFVPLVPYLKEVTLSHSHYLNTEWAQRFPRCSDAGLRFITQSI